MVDNVTDPESGLAIGLRVFGDYSLRVSDPTAFAARLAGELSTNEEITHWMREHLLKVFRTELVAQVEAESLPILGIAAHTADIEKRTIDGVRELIGGYGLEIVEVANFTISMKDEDEATLKSFRLENQRRPPAPNTPTGKAGQKTAGAAASRAGSAQQTPAGLKCPQCGNENPGSARFCLDCGHALATSVTCPDCGAENPIAAKFCGGCGKALSATEGART
jgi:membrane protease subunit (stomatin/prohibitin family)